MAKQPQVVKEDHRIHELRCINCGAKLGVAKVMVGDIQCPKSRCKKLNRFRIFSQKVLTESLYSETIKPTN